MPGCDESLECSKRPPRFLAGHSTSSLPFLAASKDKKTTDRLGLHLLQIIFVSASFSQTEELLLRCWLGVLLSALQRLRFRERQPAAMAPPDPFAGVVSPEVMFTLYFGCSVCCGCFKR